MANTWESLFRSLDKEKVEMLKKKLEQKDAQELLKSVDPQKAEKVLEQLGMSHKVQNGELLRAVEALKQNPALLQELKKLF